MKSRILAWLVTSLLVASVSAGESPIAVTQGDWPLFRGDPQSTGVAPAALPESLELLWKYTVPKGAFEGTPAIVGGQVYVGDLDGAVYALDLAAGELRWQQKIESGFMASPAVRDGRLYLGDFDGTFHCFDTATGKELWKYETQAEIDSSANFYQENVLVGSQDATLYCLQARTGELVWKHSIADQVRCTPTIVADRVFLAGCDSRLHVLNLTNGELVAQVEIKCADGRDAGSPGRQSVLWHRRRGVFRHRLEAGAGGLDLSASLGTAAVPQLPCRHREPCRRGWT